VFLVENDCCCSGNLECCSFKQARHANLGECERVEAGPESVWIGILGVNLTRLFFLGIHLIVWRGFMH
jgi:hypothetical protein